MSITGATGTEATGTEATGTEATAVKSFAAHDPVRARANDPVHQPSDSPELLAPAGDDEAMRAAVANGADAVYFGLSDFNARYRAANFTLESLPETMRYLRDHGVRGYVTFNTLVFSDELPLAAEYLAAIVAAGVDAVIVQDLGIVQLMKRLSPGFPVHGSTQMTLTEPRGIEFVRSLGVERVILARELSVTEIKRIRNETTVPVEVFVHGALCVAYSGQCLTSEALGGRSANRGQCAQACRQPYELIVDSQPRDLGEKAYLLSPQDLAAYELVADLAAAGVCSLKIEGRLKSAHYVAATTQTYRAAINAAAAGEPFTLSTTEEADLQQSFSRGFSPGFLAGVNHQRLVQGRFPKNRGVHVGEVLQKTPAGVIVRLESRFVQSTAASPVEAVLPIKPGDGVVFDDGHPEQDEQGGRVYAVLPVRHPIRVPKTDVRSDGKAIAKPDAKPDSKTIGGTVPAEECVEIQFGRGAVNLQAIAVGNLVWRTDDPALRKRLERSFAPGALARRIPLHVSVRGAVSERLQVQLFDDLGNTATVCSPEPVAAAVKHPLSLELAREQFSRLGDTVFELATVTLEQLESAGNAACAAAAIGDATATAITQRGESINCQSLPVMVPKSVLNELRRRGVAALVEARRTAPRPTILHANALDELRSENRTVMNGLAASNERAASSNADATFSRETLSVLVRNMEQLTAVLNWKPSAGQRGCDRVYCDFEEVRLSKAAVAAARSAGMPIALATPRVIKPAEQGLLQQIAVCDADAVLVRNLAALQYFSSQHPHVELIGDYSLNVANDLTAAIFVSAGLRTLTPSYDLNLAQLQAMLQAVNCPGLFELVLHQHMPMFHMEHCVFSHVLSDGSDWHTCGRPCDKHTVELRDHVGAAHPLVADVGCRNTVFNARPQSAAPYLPQLRSWGVQRFRVELLRESAAGTIELLNSYSNLLAGTGAGPRQWHQLQVLNQIGVTRGTLEFA